MSQRTFKRVNRDSGRDCQKDQNDELGDLTHYDYGFRIYNPGIGKFLSVDPLTSSYPWYTPYQFAGNTPIWASDLDGLEPDYTTSSGQNGQEQSYGVGMTGAFSLLSDILPDGATGIDNKDGSSWVFQRTSNNMGWVSPFNYTSDKYGVQPYRWDNYLKSNSGARVGQMFEKFGLEQGIDPSFLYTIAIGEGLNLFLQGGSSINGTVDGFNSLGTDHFGNDAPSIISQGYLPSSFNVGDEYTISNRTNELGESVKSANFSNLENGLRALSAIVHRRLDWPIKQQGLNFGIRTSEQEFFWTYVYFQSPKYGRKWLSDQGSWNFNRYSFDLKSQDPPGIRSKAYRRLVTWQFIKLSNLFSK